MRRRRFLQGGLLAAPLIGQTKAASITRKSPPHYRAEGAWLDFVASLICYRDRAILTLRSDEVAFHPWLFEAVGTRNEAGFFGTCRGDLVLDFIGAGNSAWPDGDKPVRVSHSLVLTIKPAGNIVAKFAPWIVSRKDDILRERYDTEVPSSRNQIVFREVYHDTPEPDWLHVAGGEFVLEPPK